MKKYILWGAFSLFLIASITIGIFNHFKKLPPNLSYASDMYGRDDVPFLYDVTYEDKLGETKVEQQIFVEAWKVIEEADKDDTIWIGCFIWRIIVSLKHQKMRVNVVLISDSF